MKTLTFKQLIIFLVAFMTLAGCDIKSKDACKENNWENAEDPAITIRLTSELNSFKFENKTYTLTNASSVKFTGTITKYYCSGEKSGSFEFSTTLYATNGVVNLTNVKIGGPYQFIFQNDKDYVQVEYRVRFEFPDGAVFRPTSSDVRNFHFLDVKYDFNFMEGYVLTTIISNQNFEKVNTL